MDPEGSLPHSQLPATCLYPELDQSSPCSHVPLPEDHGNILPEVTNTVVEWNL
jgi:hypothetical protein